MPHAVDGADPMQEKGASIAEWMAKENVSFAELCDCYGVSRKTGYKWVGRFKEDGLKGVHERARGCPSHPMQTDETTTKQLVVLRHKHPAWGANKLCAWSSARGYEVPAPSTEVPIRHRAGHDAQAEAPGQARSLRCLRSSAPLHLEWHRVGGRLQLTPGLGSPRFARAAAIDGEELVERPELDADRFRFGGWWHA
jgi:transposase